MALDVDYGRGLSSSQLIKYFSIVGPDATSTTDDWRLQALFERPSIDLNKRYFMYD